MCPVYWCKFAEDNKAFVKYDEDSGEYKDSICRKRKYKFNSRQFINHLRNLLRCNDAVIQCVSAAIGYSEHPTVNSGGDLSVTNSNSNFGAKSLVAQGFKDAFARDDVGYFCILFHQRNRNIHCN